MLGKSFIFHCRRKRLFKKILYCSQNGTVIVRLGIDFADKGFPFLLHSKIIGKTHNLLELREREAVLTVSKCLFKCLCQHFAIKVKFVGDIINIVVVLHSAGKLHQA